MKIILAKTSMRVYGSSRGKKLFNRSFNRDWNKKSNLKVLLEKYGEGEHEISTSELNDLLISSTDAATKAAKKILKKELSEVSIETVVSPKPEIRANKTLFRAIKKRAKKKDAFPEGIRLVFDKPENTFSFVEIKSGIRGAKTESEAEVVIEEDCGF